LLERTKRLVSEGRSCVSSVCPRGLVVLSLAIVGALGWAVVERSESSWLRAVTEAAVAKWLLETVSKYLLILSVPL
jgi:hypothetical protein